MSGILLFGPPGTGKTLMARQIGSMLNAQEPKIVSGPEILNKYVGQSEENIRNLFKEAEVEVSWTITTLLGHRGSLTNYYIDTIVQGKSRRKLAAHHYL